MQLKFCWITCFILYSVLVLYSALFYFVLYLINVNCLQKKHIDRFNLHALKIYLYNYYSSKFHELFIKRNTKKCERRIKSEKACDTLKRHSNAASLKLHATSSIMTVPCLKVWSDLHEYVANVDPYRSFMNMNNTFYLTFTFIYVKPN